MKLAWNGVVLCVAMIFAAWAAACGGGGPNTYGVDASVGDGPASDVPNLFGDTGQSLDVSPQSSTLVVTGPGTSQIFAARVGGTAVQPQWSVDVPAVGTIDSTGIFTASGAVGGHVTIKAQYGKLQGTASLLVKLELKDNPGNITPGVQQNLLGGGTADPAFAWLYPYDRTVFPRGLLPPTLQLGGMTPADATYVHVSLPALDYKGFFGPSSPTQINLTPPLWTTITESAAAGDVVKVEVTKIAAGQVSGPVTESWAIAQGSLKGTVYYESRFSSQSANGATMRIKPGAAQPDVLIGNCNVCHFVSADGSTLTTTTTAGGMAAYDLTQSTTSPVYTGPDMSLLFGALYPNGSVLMGCGALSPGNPASSDWSPDLVGRTMPSYPFVSGLFNPKTGAPIPAPGWDGVISLAFMPSFSPDGKQIAFNHYDSGQGHSIAVMGFDVATKTFSGLTDVATDPAHFLAWPAFTPDGKWVVYNAGSRPDYATWIDSKADLVIAHVASKTTANLDEVNGVVGGKFYLPFGEAAEGHMNYDATILPVAVGGYYWVVFTSRREYGNTINTSDPYYNADPRVAGGQPWRKKLWVAALDIDEVEHPSTKAHDISHPAFYLPGQDTTTGNYRGFWALDPCHPTGQGCASGDECCSGFCRGPSGADAAAGSTCVPPQGCANEYEKCTTDADCCMASSGFHCIAGYCAQPAPK